MNNTFTNLSLLFLQLQKCIGMKFIAAACLLIFLNSCGDGNNNNSGYDPEIAPPVVAAPANLTYTVLSVHPHDPQAYTQGLELYKGKMYEGTGDYENSSIRITDYKTGTVEKKHVMGNDKVFGEGITIFKDKIYQLTWETNLVYVYDIKDITKPIKTFNWPFQGWGITHNDTDLIISTGVNPNLYFVNPDDFRVKNILPIYDQKGPVYMLNELEFINGFVYANVYQTNTIVKIDTQEGKVVGKIDLTGLIGQYAPEFHPKADDEVLNGIAFDSTTNSLFITGKRWPKLFEIKLN